MSDVTVRQLAETVNTPAERLLKQMQDAGLPQKALEETVSEAERQTLLAWLKRSHGDSGDQPRKITIRRRQMNKLKAGQGKGTVNVEVRRKRTYVKRGESAAGEPGAEAKRQDAAPAAGIHARRLSHRG